MPGQMLPCQLESVLDVPRNLRLKFHQNRVIRAKTRLISIVSKPIIMVVVVALIDVGLVKKKI